MNITEAISEKFKDVNAAKVLSNQPTAFVKTLVKELKSRIGPIDNEVTVESGMWEPIFYRKGGGPLKTTFPKERLVIHFKWVDTKRPPLTHLYLNMEEPFKLEVNNVKKLLDLTRLTVAEAIDKIIEYGQQRGGGEIEDMPTKSINKILDKYGLELVGEHYRSMSDDYDKSFALKKKDGESFKNSEKPLAWMMLPKLIHWFNSKSFYLYRLGFSGGDDYFYIQGRKDIDARELNKKELASIAKYKTDTIKDLIGVRHVG